MNGNSVTAGFWYAARVQQLHAGYKWLFISISLAAVHRHYIHDVPLLSDYLFELWIIINYSDFIICLLMQPDDN